MTPLDAPRPTIQPTLPAYALLVTQVGLTSFGGGVSGWMLRLVVEERGWMTEAEFLSGLALCQVFPGVNVVNLAIWMGYRLHGGKGAVVGALAMIVPPAFVLIAIATAFSGLSQYDWVRTALNGIAAAAVGLTGSMSLRAWRRAATGVAPVLIAATTTVLVGLLHWPLVPVTAVMAALSVGLEMRA